MTPPGPEFVEPDAPAAAPAPAAGAGRSRMNRRNVLFAVPVVLALIVGGLIGANWAGNLGGPAADNATSRVKESAGRTAAAGSSRVHFDLSVGVGVGMDASVTGDGVLDLRNGKASVNLDLPVGSVDGVMSDGQVFVKVPAIPTSKKWLKLDLAEVMPDDGSGLGPLGRLASADPARALAAMAESAGDMRTVGTEPVRGVTTTHSRGSWDFGIDNGVFRAVAGQVLPLDVWIDADGRMRKMAVKADPDGPGPMPESSLELEMYDFGVAADVTPPPPNQVLADVTGPVKALAGLFGS